MDYDNNNEALAIVKRMVADGQISQEVAEKYFPEFKESEDERIRKEIIDFLELPHPQFVGKRDHKTWIAWLEKQGEKDNLSIDFVLGYLGIKPAYKDGNAWCILLGDNIQEGICGFGDTKEEALIAFIKELIEKQGEQMIPLDKAIKFLDDQLVNDKDKVTGESFINFRNYGAFKETFISFFKRKMLEKQGEKKPNPYSGTSFECNGHTWGMCARDNGVEILLDGELKAFLSLEKSFIYPIHPQPELAPKSAMEAAKEEKVDNQNCVKPADKVEAKFKVGDWVVHDMSDGRVSPPTQIVDMTNKSYVFDTEQCFYFSDAEEIFRKWTIQDAKDGDVLSYRDGQWIYLYKEKIDDSSFDYHILYSTIHQDLTINDSGFTLLSDEIIPATKEQRDTLMKAMTDKGYTFDFEKKELKKIEQKHADNIESSAFKDKLLELFQKFRYIKEGVPTNGDIIEYVDAHIQELINTIQNNAWSEEDRKNYQMLQKIICDSDTSANLANKLSDWLKDLKSRAQPQPRQEWSEEDKRSIRDSIFYLKSAKKYFEKDDDILWDEKWFNLCIEFLEALYKKLQPQPQWKPSDEQIGALEHFVRSIAESGYASPHDNNTKLVYSLFNDLKKLREE